MHWGWSAVRKVVFTMHHNTCISLHRVVYYVSSLWSPFVVEQFSENCILLYRRGQIILVVPQRMNTVEPHRAGNQVSYRTNRIFATIASRKQKINPTTRSNIFAMLLQRMVMLGFVRCSILPPTFSHSSENETCNARFILQRNELVAEEEKNGRFEQNLKPPLRKINEGFHVLRRGRGEKLSEEDYSRPIWFLAHPVTVLIAFLSLRSLKLDELLVAISRRLLTFYH